MTTSQVGLPLLSIKTGWLDEPMNWHALFGITGQYISYIFTYNKLLLTVLRALH